MGEDNNNIASLRSRVSALVEQEASLLTQAFELSRGARDAPGVDALFARVQAIQVERNRLQKEIGNVLGTHRMHAAGEVWRLGVYDYRAEVGADTVRVRVSQGPLGLQVLMPGRSEPVRIETLDGAFDGPLAVDDAATHQQHTDDADPREPPATPEGPSRRKPQARRGSTKKKTG